MPGEINYSTESYGLSLKDFGGDLELNDEFQIVLRGNVSPDATSVKDVNQQSQPLPPQQWKPNVGGAVNSFDIPISPLSSSYDASRNENIIIDTQTINALGLDNISYRPGVHDSRLVATSEDGQKVLSLSLNYSKNNNEIGKPEKLYVNPITVYGFNEVELTAIENLMYRLYPNVEIDMISDNYNPQTGLVNNSASPWVENGIGGNYFTDSSVVPLQGKLVDSGATQPKIIGSGGYSYGNDLNFYIPDAVSGTIPKIVTIDQQKLLNSLPSNFNSGKIGQLPNGDIIFRATDRQTKKHFDTIIRLELGEDGKLVANVKVDGDVLNNNWNERYAKDIQRYAQTNGVELKITGLPEGMNAKIGVETTAAFEKPKMQPLPAQPWKANAGQTVVKETSSPPSSINSVSTDGNVDIPLRIYDSHGIIDGEMADTIKSDGTSVNTVTVNISNAIDPDNKLGIKEISTKLIPTTAKTANPIEVVATTENGASLRFYVVAEKYGQNGKLSYKIVPSQVLGLDAFQLEYLDTTIGRTLNGSSVGSDIKFSDIAETHQDTAKANTSGKISQQNVGTLATVADTPSVNSILDDLMPYANVTNNFNLRHNIQNTVSYLMKNFDMPLTEATNYAYYISQHRNNTPAKSLIMQALYDNIDPSESTGVSREIALGLLNKGKSVIETSIKGYRDAIVTTYLIETMGMKPAAAEIIATTQEVQAYIYSSLNNSTSVEDIVKNGEFHANIISDAVAKYNNNSPHSALNFDDIYYNGKDVNSAKDIGQLARREVNENTTSLTQQALNYRVEKWVSAFLITSQYNPKNSTASYADIVKLATRLYSEYSFILPEAAADFAVNIATNKNFNAETVATDSKAETIALDPALDIQIQNIKIGNIAQIDLKPFMQKILEGQIKQFHPAMDNEKIIAIAKRLANDPGLNDFSSHTGARNIQQFFKNLDLNFMADNADSLVDKPLNEFRVVPNGSVMFNGEIYKGNQTFDVKLADGKIITVSADAARAAAGGNDGANIRITQGSDGIINVSSFVKGGDLNTDGKQYGQNMQYDLKLTQNPDGTITHEIKNIEFSGGNGDKNSIVVRENVLAKVNQTIESGLAGVKINDVSEENIKSLNTSLARGELDAAKSNDKQIQLSPEAAETFSKGLTNLTKAFGEKAAQVLPPALLGSGVFNIADLVNKMQKDLHDKGSYAASDLAKLLEAGAYTTGGALAVSEMLAAAGGIIAAFGAVGTLAAAAVLGAGMYHGLKNATPLEKGAFAVGMFLIGMTAPVSVPVAAALVAGAGFGVIAAGLEAVGDKDIDVDAARDYAFNSVFPAAEANVDGNPYGVEMAGVATGTAASPTPTPAPETPKPPLKREKTEFAGEYSDILGAVTADGYAEGLNVSDAGQILGNVPGFTGVYGAPSPNGSSPNGAVAPGIPMSGWGTDPTSGQAVPVDGSGQRVYRGRENDGPTPTPVPLGSSGVGNQSFNNYINNNIQGQTVYNYGNGTVAVGNESFKNVTGTQLANLIMNGGRIENVGSGADVEILYKP